MLIYSWLRYHFNITTITNCTKFIQFEHVAKQLRCWTWDQRVLGSIPAVLVVCKKPWANWIHIASGHTAVMGTWCTDLRLDWQLQLHFVPTSMIVWWISHRYLDIKQLPLLLYWHGYTWYYAPQLGCISYKSWLPGAFHCARAASILFMLVTVTRGRFSKW